jgi:hypothetical protein
MDQTFTANRTANSRLRELNLPAPTEFDGLLPCVAEYTPVHAESECSQPRSVFIANHNARSIAVGAVAATIGIGIAIIAVGIAAITSPVAVSPPATAVAIACSVARSS